MVMKEEGKSEGVELTAVAEKEKEKEKELEKEQGLEICLRLGGGWWPSWICITIPRIATTLKALSLSKDVNVKHKHKHTLETGARALPPRYDILKNRFRVLLADGNQLNGPFPALSPHFKPSVVSCVLGSTLCCIGGNVDDLDVRGSSLEQVNLPLHRNYLDHRMEKVGYILSRNLGIPKLGDGICHRLYTLDMRDPMSGWRVGKPLVSPRLTPLLVSYQGKLYAFGGNAPTLAFAEVYDPVSDTWTQLPSPPFTRLPDNQMVVVPLKGLNKLWVFGKKPEAQVDYTFDVVTEKWEECNGALHIIHLLSEQSLLVSALTPQNHSVVYWLDKKGMVYAYNMSTNQLFKGSVCEDNHSEPQFGNHVSLHHLSRDLFCLISSENPLDFPWINAVLHVTLLRISLKPPPSFSKPPLRFKTSVKSKGTSLNPLMASVLACFAYPFKESIHFKDSYIMSNKN